MSQQRLVCRLKTGKDVLGFYPETATRQLQDARRWRLRQAQDEVKLQDDCKMLRRCCQDGGQDEQKTCMVARMQ